MNVEADDISEIEQLDHVDAAFTVLDVREEGLMPAEPSRDLS